MKTKKKLKKELKKKNIFVVKKDLHIIKLKKFVF